MDSAPSRSLLGQARLAQSLTVAWMVVELSVALSAGIAAHSVALTTFGADSAIEFVTALVVLRVLVMNRPGEAQEDLDRREREASRIVGWALFVLIGYIVVTSLLTLLGVFRPEASPAGVALALSAIVVMTLLWRWRLRLSARLQSPALRADAACSLVCVYMSAALLAGLALNGLLGWWWADPLAALGMIWWIRGEGLEALEAARTGSRCECGL